MARWLQSAGLQHLAAPLAAAALDHRLLPSLLMQVPSPPSPFFFNWDSGMLAFILCHSILPSPLLFRVHHPLCVCTASVWISSIFLCFRNYCFPASGEGGGVGGSFWTQTAMGISDSLPLFLIRDVVLFNPRIRTSCHSYLPSVFRPSKYEPLLLLTSPFSLCTVQKPRGFQEWFSIFGSGCPPCPFYCCICPEVLLQNGVSEHWHLVSLESYVASRRKDREIPACYFVFSHFWKIQKWTFLPAFMLCSWSLLIWWLSSWKQCERNVSVHGQCL